MDIKELSQFYKGDEYEAKIAKSMAETYGFELKVGHGGLFAKCKRCGKRFNKNFIGKGLNERMIEHGGRFMCK